MSVFGSRHQIIHMLHGSKALVVSDMEKSHHRRWQMRLEEMNESEPLMRHRNLKLTSKLEVGCISETSSPGVRLLGEWRPVYRWHEFKFGSHMQLREPSCCMAIEKHKEQISKADSREGSRWDGDVHKSVEGSVMELEQRDVVILRQLRSNCDMQEDA